MIGDAYTCANCKLEFLKAHSDEEAREDMKETFPDEVEDGEAMAIICDDCYKKIEAHFGWDQA